MSAVAGHGRTGRSAPGGPLIFQIGFHRCGTTTLAAFFERCGLACVHYDRGRLGRRLRENLAAGRPPLAGYEGCRAFANMQYEDGADYFDGMAYFRELDAAYDARFVLNTRPLDHWLRSLAVHYARRPRALGLPCLEARFGTTDPVRVAEGWRALREAHHRRVRAELPPERLLVFDIESDPPERLCEFIGAPRAMARHYRVENPSLDRWGEALAACLPFAVKRALPDRLKRPVKRWLGARGGRTPDRETPDRDG